MQFTSPSLNHPSNEPKVQRGLISREGNAPKIVAHDKEVITRDRLNLEAVSASSWVR